MDTELYWRLLAIVTARGLTNTKVGRYRDIAVWDGGARWDTGSCGPVPSSANIVAVTMQQITALQQAELDRQALRLVDDAVDRAVARAAWEELQKCQVRQGQSLLTWPQFRDAIKADVKARLNGGA